MEVRTSCGGQGHHDSVTLPDGSAILGCSFSLAGYHAAPVPGFGLYLDERWQPPWPNVHVRWPDFGLPSDPAVLHARLDDLLDRARRGQVVAIGCLGGHGRTGTALAITAAKAGLMEDAVDWIRAAYCEQAIETTEQEDFVRRHQNSAGF